uniref:ATPase_AAA_core domain-containing protein n=1 Tax=Heterorhabditis bacteriophora TaxID=37862 RepID=A0A1I7WWY6_HETBA
MDAFTKLETLFSTYTRRSLHCLSDTIILTLLKSQVVPDFWQFRRCCVGRLLTRMQLRLLLSGRLFTVVINLYQTQRRGGNPPDQIHLESCMRQEFPGTPRLSVLGFQVRNSNKLYIIHTIIYSFILLVFFCSQDHDVAAVIVEPIQAEGGDHYGSPQFFQALRNITKKNGIVFIVDEV